MLHFIQQYFACWTCFGSQCCNVYSIARCSKCQGIAYLCIYMNWFVKDMSFITSFRPSMLSGPWVSYINGYQNKHVMHSPIFTSKQQAKSKNAYFPRYYLFPLHLEFFPKIYIWANQPITEASTQNQYQTTNQMSSRINFSWERFTWQ
jgi:hypothetical protein